MLRTAFALAFAAALLLTGYASTARAEDVDESVSVPLLSTKKPLLLKTDTKTSASASGRIHFWVGLEGEVEAVEQDCGERALFDEIVDSILEWKFQRKNFQTNISFVRRGRRVWLLQELPAKGRPKHVCS